jgi:hypothetical protein
MGVTPFQARVSEQVLDPALHGQTAPLVIAQANRRGMADSAKKHGDTVKNTKTPIPGLILILLTSVSKSSGACDFPPPGLTEGQRTRFTGVYTSEPYEYLAKIPQELAGYDIATGGGGNHIGFGLIGGKSSPSYIEVTGRSNSFDDESPIDAAIRFLRDTREGGKAIRSATIRPSHLGQLSAVRLFVNYTCSGSAEPYVQISTIALSPGMAWLYEVALYAKADHFRRDAMMLDEVLKSWKYTGRPTR